MEIRRIQTSETFPLRIEILRKGIAKDFQFVGDEAATTFHLGAFIQDECVGILSCMKKEHALWQVTDAYQLRGMAVQGKLQKSGVGKALVLESLRLLKERECKLVWCNARETAVGFYEKMHFKTIGSRFQIPKVGPHFVMFFILE
jgi:ribosomal protein S18 acetylase RimI-like enzyme